MNPFLGLLKKDFRISRNYFFMWSGMVLLGLVGGIGLSAYTSQPAGTLPAVISLGSLHFTFASLMMLSMLGLEAKTQLWLYSPRSGLHLILSKLSVIFLYQIVLQMVLTLYAALNLFWFGREVYEQIGWNLFFDAAVFLNLLILVVGFYYAAWVTFLWAVFYSLSHKAKVFRWAIVFGIVAAYSLLTRLVSTFSPVEKLLHSYQVNVISQASLEYNGEKWKAVLDSANVSVIPVILYALLIVLLLFFASRLLERKVEV